MDKVDFIDFVKYRQSESKQQIPSRSDLISRINLTGLPLRIINEPTLWTCDEILESTIWGLFRRIDLKKNKPMRFSVFVANTKTALDRIGFSPLTTSPKQRSQLLNRPYVEAVFKLNIFRQLSPNRLYRSAYDVNPDLTFDEVVAANDRNIDKLDYIRDPKNPTVFIGRSLVRPSPQKRMR